MRTYEGMRLAPDMNMAQLRAEAQRADNYLRHLSAALGRITLAPQGSGPAGGSGGTVVDLTQFWYLPGRLPEQRAYGRNILEANAQAAGGVSAPSFYKKVGFFAPDGSRGIANAWLSIEGTQGSDTHVGTAERTFFADRHWIFPAFNQIASGSQFGVHYFVDADDYQLIQNKTFTSWVMELTDTSGVGFVGNIARGETQVGTAQAMTLLFHGSFPTTTWKRSAVSPTGGSYPALAIPPLDVNAATAAPSREKHHILCVMRKDHTDLTPFEPGGPVMGGATGRELYPMYTTAQGTLPAPADNSLIMHHPVVTTNCDFVIASAIVTMASTTGIYAGQRMRQTAASYSLPEDTHVVSVDSPTQITMSTTWPAGNSTVEISFFGMVWVTPGSISSFIDHGALLGLTDDDHTQYLRLAGRSGGQRIGAGTHAGASQASDTAIEGQLLIDHPNSNTSFQASRALDIRYNPVANGTCVNISMTYSNSVTSGTLTGIDLVANGTMSAGGSSSLRGFRFITTGNAGTGATIPSTTGGLFQVSMSTAGGTINRNIGLQVIALADTNATTHSLGTQGIEIQLNQRGATTTLRWLSLQQGSGTPSGTVSELYLIDCGSSAHINQNTVVDWTAIRIPDAPTNPTGVIRGLKIGAIKSHHVGQFRFGDTTTPTHSIEIAAGTTTRAPLLLTSGTSLTTALAGAIEMTTDDLFFTITTGPARKRLLMADPSGGLTSSRIPFATTNGRLTDDAGFTFVAGLVTAASLASSALTSGRVIFAGASGVLSDDSDFTFATDTLTVTKIAATTLSGLLTFADAVDIAFNTGTGTKIGTATNQKLAFWNAVPIVQPTTAVAAATFVANTSGIVDDSATFDGYTLGQVVKALRNAGLLA